MHHRTPSSPLLAASFPYNALRNNILQTSRKKTEVHSTSHHINQQQREGKVAILLKPVANMHASMYMCMQTKTIAKVRVLFFLWSL